MYLEVKIVGFCGLIEATYMYGRSFCSLRSSGFEVNVMGGEKEVATGDTKAIGRGEDVS